MSEFQSFIDAIKSESDEKIVNKFKSEYLESTDNYSWRPLHHACRYGRVELVKFLLSKLCEIDSQTNNGYQSIHFACENGHTDIVKILIAYKCDINKAEINWGYQPIHLAYKNGHIDIVKVLIANNCDVKASDKYNEFQPIHFACKDGHVEIANLLIANKCDINSSDYNGYQPIHFGSKHGHIDIVNILIANKCDINAFDKKGFYPIHFASINGHIDVVKILIANKCDIKASENWGHQPIHMACMNGHIDIVKILIENKCDINAPDKNGYQPIHLACINGNIDIVKALIGNSYFINVPTKVINQGEYDQSIQCIQSPIEIAKRNKNQELIDILINAEIIELIAKAVDLCCNDVCDHRFCRKSLVDEEFKKGEFVGKGSFGKVFKYKISNTNREIVIKRLNKYNCEDKKNIEGNINKYSYRIVHRNIIRYFGALEKSQKLCIYMEYMTGGSLKDLIEKSKWMENSKVIKYTKQILDGLQFIHSQGIIHRDIKPDNMLLDHDETLKLTDFGFSKSLRIDSFLEPIRKTITSCGTPNYMAPEVICSNQYDFPADIWSTGASIIHMITGNFPYHWLPSYQVMRTIETTKKIEFTPCEPISETMQSFIDYLLTPEQSERPSAKYLLDRFTFTNDEIIRNQSI